MMALVLLEAVALLAFVACMVLAIVELATRRRCRQASTDAAEHEAITYHNAMRRVRR